MTSLMNKLKGKDKVPMSPSVGGQQQSALDNGQTSVIISMDLAEVSTKLLTRLDVSIEDQKSWLNGFVTETNDLVVNANHLTSSAKELIRDVQTILLPLKIFAWFGLASGIFLVGSATISLSSVIWNRPEVILDTLRDWNLIW